MTHYRVTTLSQYSNQFVMDIFYPNIKSEGCMCFPFTNRYIGLSKRINSNSNTYPEEFFYSRWYTIDERWLQWVQSRERERGRKHWWSPEWFWLLVPHARLAWVYIGTGSSKVDAKRDVYMPAKTAAVLAAQKPPMETLWIRELPGFLWNSHGSES